MGPCVGVCGSWVFVKGERRVVAWGSSFEGKGLSLAWGGGINWHGHQPAHSPTLAGISRHSAQPGEASTPFSQQPDQGATRIYWTWPVRGASFPCLGLNTYLKDDGKAGMEAVIEGAGERPGGARGPQCRCGLWLQPQKTSGSGAQGD